MLGLLVGLGIVIRLCSWSDGSVVIVCVILVMLVGVMLFFDVLLLMFICMYMLSGGRCVGCCFDRCCVIFSWLIEWI